MGQRRSDHDKQDEEQTHLVCCYNLIKQLKKPSAETQLPESYICISFNFTVDEAMQTSIHGDQNFLHK